MWAHHTDVLTCQRELSLHIYKPPESSIFFITAPITFELQKVTKAHEMTELKSTIWDDTCLCAVLFSQPRRLLLGLLEIKFDVILDI
jgi:hypothetical protein